MYVSLRKGYGLVLETLSAGRFRSANSVPLHPRRRGGGCRKEAPGLAERRTPCRTDSAPGGPQAGRKCPERATRPYPGCNPLAHSSWQRILMRARTALRNHYKRETALCWRLRTRKDLQARVSLDRHNAAEARTAALLQPPPPGSRGARGKSGPLCEGAQLKTLPRGQSPGRAASAPLCLRNP